MTKTSRVSRRALSALPFGLVVAFLSPTVLAQTEANGAADASIRRESEPGAARRPSFLEVGARAGYALGFGSVYAGERVDELYAGAVPLLFEALFRVQGAFGMGLYAGLSPSVRGPALDACDDCSLWNYRFGFQVTRHLNARGTVDPWFGVGIGYEATAVTRRFDADGVEYSADYTYSALPELMLQLGVDVGGEVLAFGPFASASYGVYSAASTRVRCVGCVMDSRTEAESGIDDDLRRAHSWVTFGIRGTYMR